ncbi:MAG: ParB/RepB/Spo0J family partition protein [Gammaproteobacteria bacterium]|jgi:ParB family chromosome partitioning protein|nr:chromosome partitioning protein ParB [Gammaproteobacteria bacterium]MDP6096270.1 ParB/RepB/Spo0J family partition protein [Gammaproteobacteria bacterium]MDP7455092.1 ParB/RepB/Spo0J family partition protein [Gammaproteobacteria bacterium]HJO12460.1 ParB/RepB/Spo0J family partition protein [Gammaproteobacteria bacterium]|tara:strand:- start:2548 stop:3453 length:906 start_codon:yes stop_codon:yes gene_type:complete
MTEKRKLGKGLDALLSGGGNETMASLLGKPKQRAALSATEEAKDGDLRNIPIDLIQRGKYQPRTDMREDALQELASSIRNQGVLQPIVVRPISSEKYEIIAGERRWRASQIAELDTIPAIIKPVGDEAAIAMSLIENIQREDLNPIEEAMALKRLQDEFELTQQEVADAVGKSRATVTNLIRLIGLAIDVRRMVEHGDLEMGHARALLSLPDMQQSEVARTVVGRGLSVRQTESLVRRLIAGGGSRKESGIIDPDIKNLEENLADKLGAKVLIQHTAKGKGRLILKYNSLDELDGILAHIN